MAPRSLLLLTLSATACLQAVQSMEQPSNQADASCDSDKNSPDDDDALVLMQGNSDAHLRLTTSSFGAREIGQSTAYKSGYFGSRSAKCFSWFRKSPGCQNLVAKDGTYMPKNYRLSKGTKITKRKDGNLKITDGKHEVIASSIILLDSPCEKSDDPCELIEEQAQNLPDGTSTIGDDSGLVHTFKGHEVVHRGLEEELLIGFDNAIPDLAGDITRDFTGGGMNGNDGSGGGSVANNGCGCEAGKPLFCPQCR